MPGQVAVLMGAAHKIALESCLGAVFGVRCQKTETSPRTAATGIHLIHFLFQLRNKHLVPQRETNTDAAPNGVKAILNSVMFYGAPDNISLK